MTLSGEHFRAVEAESLDTDKYLFRVRHGNGVIFNPQHLGRTRLADDHGTHGLGHEPVLLAIN
jgi:hypothetical protein